MAELVHRALKLVFWVTVFTTLLGGPLAWPVLSGLALVVWQVPRFICWSGAGDSHTPASK